MFKNVRFLRKYISIININISAVELLKVYYYNIKLLNLIIK